MCGQAWPSSSWRHTPPTWLPTWRDSRLSSAWKVFLTPRWDYSWDLNKYWNTTDAEDEAQNQPRGGNTCTHPLVCIVCKDSCLSKHILCSSQFQNFAIAQSGNCSSVSQKKLRLTFLAEPQHHSRLRHSSTFKCPLSGWDIPVLGGRSHVMTPTGVRGHCKYRAFLNQ